MSVKLIADDKWMNYLTADMEGTTLYLDLKEVYAYDIDGVTTRVEVTMLELTSLSLSSSAQARLDGFQTSKPLELEFTGSTLPAWHPYG